MTTARNLTRQSGSSFASSFRLLPKRKREAITAVYAWCRYSDDIADSNKPAAQKRDEMSFWESELERIFAGQATSEIGRSLQLTLQDFPIAQQHFQDMLKAMWHDIESTRFRTWPDLLDYCYGVASTVGLMAIEIFGYEDHRTRDFAVKLGMALQLTNIARDVRRDAGQQRIYLPGELLAKHDFQHSDFARLTYSQRFRQMMEEYAEKTLLLYREAHELLPVADSRSMRPSLIMGGIYLRLLLLLVRHGFDIFSQDLHLSSRQKKLLTLRFWLRPDKALLWQKSP
jgi:phytoene synthase